MKEKNDAKEKLKTAMDENNIGNFIGLTAVMLGIYLTIAFGILIFSGQNANLLVPIAWAFVVLGIVVSFFMYKTAKR